MEWVRTQTWAMRVHVLWCENTTCEVWCSHKTARWALSQVGWPGKTVSGLQQRLSRGTRRRWQACQCRAGATWACQTLRHVHPCWSLEQTRLARIVQARENGLAFRQDYEKGVKMLMVFRFSGAHFPARSERRWWGRRSEWRCRRDQRDTQQQCAWSMEMLEWVRTQTWAKHVYVRL